MPFYQILRFPDNQKTNFHHAYHQPVTFAPPTYAKKLHPCRFAGRCIAYREEEGTKRRVILRYPAPRRVMGRRLLRLGTILPSPQEDREVGGR